MMCSQNTYLQREHLSQQNREQNVRAAGFPRAPGGRYLLYVVGHVVWGDALLKGALYRSC